MAILGMVVDIRQLGKATAASGCRLVVDGRVAGDVGGVGEWDIVGPDFHPHGLFGCEGWVFFMLSDILCGGP